MKNSKTISNPENVRSSSVALFPYLFIFLPNSYLRWEMIIKNDSVARLAITPPLKQSQRLTNEPPQARCWAPSSSAVWCTWYTGSSFPPSPLCTHRTNLSKGTEKSPPALSDDREKRSTKKTLADSLDKCKRQWVWLMSTLCGSHTSWGPSDEWAIKLAVEPSIFFFIPLSPTLPGGLKFPGWSSTNLFRSSLQYFYFIVAKKKLSPILLVKTLPTRCLAASRGRAGGRAEGLGQRHQGDAAPWWPGTFWPSGLAPTEKRCWVQRLTWTWWLRGTKWSTSWILL